MLINFIVPNFLSFASLEKKLEKKLVGRRVFDNLKKYRKSRNKVKKLIKSAKSELKKSPVF